MAKYWLGRWIGSGGLLRNPSLKSDRYRRRLTALQGEVAVADQMAHLAVADPNRQAPQPHAGPRAVRLHPLGGRRLQRVTFGESFLGNAFPPVVTASVI